VGFQVYQLKPPLVILGDEEQPPGPPIFVVFPFDFFRALFKVLPKAIWEQSLDRG
jgi:hypothetical protein